MRRILVVAAVAFAMGCPPPPSPPVDVTLNGAVQKGPFVIGSSIAVSALDAALAPTGQVFNTSTSNDLGEFQLSFTASGPVQIEGNGFYYNEITEALSQGNLTLRAFYVPQQAGAQQAYVNVITHLIVDRVRALTASGPPDAGFVDVVEQAESELRAELAIAPPGFDPARRGVDMNVLGGDDDANAYLLAVSAVLAKAGFDRNAASADAELQNLINGIAVDLADGTLSEPNKAAVQSALASLDVPKMMAAFQARLTATGSSAVVPDVQRVIDQDGDGRVNADDNCDYAANADQQASDPDAYGDACDECPQTPCDDDCLPAAGGYADVCVDRCDDGCADGAECLVATFGGQQVEICSRSCDPLAPDCGAGEVCAPVIQGDRAESYLCQPRADGPLLSAGADCFALPAECDDGLTCIVGFHPDLGAAVGFCAETCANGDVAACGGAGCTTLMEGPQQFGFCPPVVGLHEACTTLPANGAAGEAVIDTCGTVNACGYDTSCGDLSTPCCLERCTPPTAAECAGTEVCAGSGYGTNAAVCVEPIAVGDPCPYAGRCAAGAACNHGYDATGQALPQDQWICATICGGDGDCTGGTSCAAASLEGADVCVELPAQCTNDVQDGDESDVDCGGSVCPRCGTFQTCNQEMDCVGGDTEPSCFDVCLGVGGTDCAPRCIFRCNVPTECATDEVCAYAMELPAAAENVCLPQVATGDRCFADEQCPSGVCHQPTGTCASPSDAGPPPADAGP